MSTMRMRDRRRTRKPCVTVQTTIRNSTCWKRWPLSTIVVVSAVFIALLWMWTACNGPVKPVPTSLSNQLNRLAFQGKLDEVKQLVERHSELDWTLLGSRGGGGGGGDGGRGGGGGELTAIHHALHGRQLSLTTQSKKLKGEHEVIPLHGHQSPCLACLSSNSHSRRSSPTLSTMFIGIQVLAALSTMQSTSETSLYCKCCWRPQTHLLR